MGVISKGRTRGQSRIRSGQASGIALRPAFPVDSAAAVASLSLLEKLDQRRHVPQVNRR
jgi:hypothetical protein